MEVKAIHKTARIAPRKARLVIDLIRGKDIKEAQAILMFTPKGASPLILKVLNSAVANAEQIMEWIEKSICKRSLREWRYHNEKNYLELKVEQISKRTSHITVVVAEREWVVNKDGSKVNPIGLRVGVIRDWDSNGMLILNKFQHL